MESPIKARNMLLPESAGKDESFLVEEAEGALFIQNN